MTEDKLTQKILEAMGRTPSGGYSIREGTCGRYGADDFDMFWEGLLEKRQRDELAIHCMECLSCLGGLSRARELEERSRREQESMDADRFREVFHRAAADTGLFLEQNQAWAAAQKETGRQGQALGVMVSELTGTGSLVQCSAWVGTDQDGPGKLELWGSQVESTVGGIRRTRPLDYLEEKLLANFSTNPCLRGFHLDRRTIYVDLSEKVIMEAASLSLCVIMAAVNAVAGRREGPSRVYAADIRQDGALEPVGRVESKLRAARELGIAQMVLAEGNRADCPERYLDIPGFRILFYDHLSKLFSDSGIEGYEGFAVCEPETGGRFFLPGREKIPRAADDEMVTGAASNYEKILAAIKREGHDTGKIPEVFPLLERICHTRPRGAEFSAAFLMGDLKRIASVLAPSGLTFSEEQTLGETAGQITELFPMINGHGFCFVLDSQAILRGVRKTDLEVYGRTDIAPLLSGKSHHFAVISMLTGAMVFYFPPPGGNLHVYSFGKLIGKYLHGRWETSDYEVFLKELSRAAEQCGIRYIAALRAARAAVCLAGRGSGAIFAFFGKKSVSDGDFGRFMSSSALCALGMKLADARLEDFTTGQIADLAGDDGAMAMDHRGKILGWRVRLKVDQDGMRPGFGSRHEAARRFSEHPGCMAAAASRYGTVTLFYQGRAVVTV